MSSLHTLSDFSSHIPVWISYQARVADDLLVILEKKQKEFIAPFFIIA